VQGVFLCFQLRNRGHDLPMRDRSNQGKQLNLQHYSIGTSADLTLVRVWAGKVVFPFHTRGSFALEARVVCLKSEGFSLALCGWTSGRAIAVSLSPLSLTSAIDPFHRRTLCFVVTFFPQETS